MIRKIWRFVWITVTVVIGILLLLLVVISQLDLNQFKGAIETQVAELTGRQLTIAGDLQVDISMQPSIRIEKLSFANASWGKQTQMLSLELLLLKIELLPLLDKKLVVEKMSLKGGYLSVETNADGKNNWQLEKFASEEPEISTIEDTSKPFELPFLPILRQVQFDAINFYYGNAAENIETDVVFNLQFSQSDKSEAIHLSADGSVNQQVFTLSGETRFLDTVTTKNLTDLGFRFKADVDALGMTLAVSGVIESPLTVEGVDIVFSIEADDLDKTVTVATGQSIYRFIPESEQLLSLNLSAQLADINNGYELSDFKLKLADTDVSGKLSYIEHADRPEIAAKLFSDNINLDLFLAKQIEAVKTSENKKGQAGKNKQQEKNTGKNKNTTIKLPDAVLPFDIFEMLNADINLNIEQLQYDGIKPKAIKLNAILRDGLLQVEQFNLNLNGASVRSSLTIDSRQNTTPRIKTTLNIDKLKLGRLAQRLQIEQFKAGVLQTRIKLASRGKSVKSLLMGLEGNADVQVNNVRLEFKKLEQPATDQQVIEHRDERKHIANIKQLKIDFVGISQPFNYRLNGEIDNQPLLLSGSIDSLNSILNNKTLELQLKLEAFKIAFEAEGNIVTPLDLETALIDVSLGIPDPKESIRGIAQFVPAIKQNENIAGLPIAFKGKLTATSDTIRFDDMLLKAASNDLSGDVSADFRGDKPFIEATFESQLLDLNEIFPVTKLQENEVSKVTEKKPDNSPVKNSEKTKLFSDEPFPALNAMASVDIHFKYTLKKLISNEQTIDNIWLNLILKDSLLKLDPLSIDFAKGTIKTNLAFSAGEKPHFQLDSTITNLDYGRLLTILGIHEYARGKLDAEIKLAGEGDSVSALMASLDGGLRVTTVNGLLDSKALKFLSKDVASFIPFTDKSDRQKIKCGVVQFDIHNGIASTHSMVINTGSISALGTGDINLGNETLSLYIAPRSKRTSVLTLALVPVNITGPLSAPSIKPDLAGTTISATQTATNIGLTIVTSGIWLLAEGLTNKLWDQFIDDTDYCAKALAGEKIVPLRIKLEAETAEDDGLSDILDDDENSWM